MNRDIIRRPVYYYALSNERRHRVTLFVTSRVYFLRAIKFYYLTEP